MFTSDQNPPWPPLEIPSPPPFDKEGNGGICSGNGISRPCRAISSHALTSGRGPATKDRPAPIRRTPAGALCFGGANGRPGASVQRREGARFSERLLEGGHVEASGRDTCAGGQGRGRSSSVARGHADGLAASGTDGLVCGGGAPAGSHQVVGPLGEETSGGGGGRNR